MNYLIDLVIGIFLVVLGLYLDHRTQIFSRWLPNNFDAAGPEYLGTINLKAIGKTLKALPPMQRSDIAQKYVGSLGKWRVKYRGVMKKLDGTYEVYFHPTNAPDAHITAHMDLAKHPALIHLKQNYKMWIAGEIDRVEYLDPLVDISLVNVKTDL